MVPGVVGRFNSLALRIALPERSILAVIGSRCRALPINTSTRRSLCQQASVDSLHLGCDSPKAPVLILPSTTPAVHQRLTNGVDTTLAQALIVSIGAARIGVAVDAHLGRSDSASCKPRCR